MTSTDLTILLAVTIGLPLIGYVWRRWVTDSQDSGQSSPGPAGGRAGRPGVANVAALKAGNGPALGNPAGPRQSDFGGSAACGGATRGAAAEGQRIQRDGKPASQFEPDGNAPVTPVEQEDCPAHQTYYPTAGMVPGESPDCKETPNGHQVDHG